ncbi:MAG TPA: hypothetical protein VI112_05195, partial [Bacteroidia bacterium]
MQNKGAVRLFAILLALACLFYLSFSLITRGVEKDAKQTADTYVMKQSVKDTASKMSNGDKQRYDSIMEAFRNSRETRYLDSMRKQVVWNLWPFKFTYEDCKEKEINLGLDLRGGMNVTLEVSVQDIIKGMSNKPDDPKLQQALTNTLIKEKTDSRDFATVFGEEMKKQDNVHPLSYYFRSIDNKEITSKSTDEEVLNILRRNVTQAINTAEQTLHARIDRFGVTQPTIQKLSSSGRIMIELPGVSDKERVRSLLTGTANLEFWETFETSEVIQYYGQINDAVSKTLHPLEAANDSLQADSIKRADSLKLANAKADSMKNKDNKNKVVKRDKKYLDDSIAAKKKADSIDAITKKNDSLNKKSMSQKDSVEMMKRKYPLQFVLMPNVDRQTGKVPPGCVFARAFVKDTGTVNQYLNLPEVKRLMPENLRLLWGSKPDKFYKEDVLDLYAIKVTSKDGKAALYGDIITRANKTTDQKEGGNFSIEMSMTNEAATKWKSITHDNMPQGKDKPGREIAIVLGDLVYSAPTVQSEIANGNSQITGNFSSREAEDLANILSAGKLPAKAIIVEEQIVGPTLGAQNIRDGFLSFGIALLVVLVFMAIYYNRAGLVADVALFVNMFF